MNSIDKVNKELKNYIENNIFPEYSKNDSGHDINHIQYVIDRSFKFADTIPDINYDIVYTIASYHDINKYINSSIHEKIAAEYFNNDTNIKKFFNPKQRKLIKEAIEDHRASSSHTPRSIYGRIVSTADKYNSVDQCLLSSYTFGKKEHPEMNDQELFERAHDHLNKKFGVNGYAKLYFKDEQYENFLKEIQNLLADKNHFIEVQRNYINDLKAKRVIE